jgi:hypothetical protein
MTELRKLPECYTCDFYAHSPYLVCSEYPLGPEGDRCQTYTPNPVPPEGDPLSVYPSSSFGGRLLRWGVDCGELIKDASSTLKLFAPSPLSADRRSPRDTP